MLFTALTEGVIRTGFTRFEQLIFFFPNFFVEFDELTIFSILLRHGLFNCNFTESTKHAFGVVKLMTLIVESLEWCQVRFTAFTDNHGVSESKLLAFKLVLVDHVSLALDSLLELEEKITYFFIIQVDLGRDLLYVNWLQEVTFFAFFFITCLSVHDNFAFIIHSDIFEALTLI